MRTPFLLVYLCLARSAAALVVTPESVSQALAGAPIVAEIEVRRIEGATDASLGIIHKATAEILRIVSIRDSDARAGEARPGPGDEIVVVGPGGELGDRGVYLAGFSRPRAGKRYLAHLARRPDGAFEVKGFEQGLVPLVVEREYSRNRVDGSNGEGNGPFLFWDDSYFPIPYFISAPTFQAFPEFVAGIDASFATWRNVPDTRFDFIAMGCSNALLNQNDGVNNVILITKDWPFDPQAIAITRNFYVSGTSSKSGMILDSDILLNGVNHAFTADSETASDFLANDIRNILTHEIGHFLGLGHEVTPVDPDATMYAAATPGETKKRGLRRNDINAIHAAYLGAGKKFAGPPRTVSCQLGAPTSCIAVHGRAHASGWTSALWAAWLALVLVSGRRLASPS